MEVGESSKRDMLQANKDEQFANNVLTEFQLLLGRAWRNASRNKPVLVGGALGGLACTSPPAWQPFRRSTTGFQPNG